MLVRQIDQALSLRLLEPRHAEALAAIAPGDLACSGGEWLFPPGGASAMIEQGLTAFARAAAVPTGLWLRDELIGVLRIAGINSQNRSGGLDYALGAPFRGRGLMTRAGRGLIGYAFDELKLNRLQLEADVSNQPSCRLAERLGFIREGVIRDRYWNGREFRDASLYGLLAPGPAPGTTSQASVGQRWPAPSRG